MQQSAALTAALRSGGSAVELGSFPGQSLMGHRTIDRSLGDPGYAATLVVDAWLKRVFGR